MHIMAKSRTLSRLVVPEHYLRSKITIFSKLDAKVQYNSCISMYYNFTVKYSCNIISISTPFARFLTLGSMASGSSAPTPRLIVMRHGERADAAKDYGWKDPEFPYDPPLTPRGHEHAKTAGAIIRSKFSSLVGIRVLCSPFLRCLQTATHVADSLEQASIEVVPQFADILSEYGFIYSDVR